MKQHTKPGKEEQVRALKHGLYRTTLSMRTAFLENDAQGINTHIQNFVLLRGAFTRLDKLAAEDFGRKLKQAMRTLENKSSHAPGPKVYRQEKKTHHTGTPKKSAVIKNYVLTA